MLTLGSLFDGIGGWQIAAIRAGAAVLWSSEIEPFPCAVTKKHFPETVQLGDITKIDGERLWPVDIICAGSPCQDLSIAGKQEGLKGARSGLFRTAIRLVRDMRRASGGRFPRFFVWENVPGAFSSNHGMDFLAVLEEIGEATLPMPDGGRWAQAGMVELPSCQIAWRVLDAQYWGVPQRRKRIFLVADFRGHSAGEILFERESVRGDSSESGEAGEGFTAGTESGIGKSSGNCLTPWDYERRRISSVNGVAPSLTGCDGGGGRNPGGLVFAAGFKAGAGADAGGLGYQVEQMPTLTSAESGTQRPTVAVYDMTHADEVMRKVPDGRSPTLNARMGTGGNQVPVLAFDTTQVTSPGNYSHPKPGDPCHPLCAGAHVPAVAVYGVGVENGVAGTLDASYYKGTGARSGKERCAVCVGNGQLHQGVSDKAGALNCMHDQQAVMIKKSVRRLTPTECERLQGLPDGYTLIDDKTCSDTARYKALGNGMAQPCADYVIRRIVEVCDVGEKETDGSAN